MIKDFFKKFEADMASAAFAEEGEFDTARAISLEGKNSGKKVLLGAEGTGVDHKAYRYALNLCRRVGADLEVLQVEPGRIEEEVARYVEKRRDILFVVVGSHDDSKGKKGGLGKGLAGALERLGCPLVVVSSAVKA